MTPRKNINELPNDVQPDWRSEHRRSEDHALDLERGTPIRTNLAILVATIMFVAVSAASGTTAWLTLKWAGDGRDKRIAAVEQRQEKQDDKMSEALHEIISNSAAQTKTLNNISNAVDTIQEKLGDVVTGTEFRYFVGWLGSLNPDINLPDMDKVFLRRKNVSSFGGNPRPGR